MPKYFPINAGVSFESVCSDLLAISWKDNDLSADFVLPKTEGRALRVRFDKPTIVRLLDEFPLSTEDDTKNEGLVSMHFAYRVEGSAFETAQSSVWKEVCGPVQHYRFITGGGCVDVLSHAQPSFEIIEISE